MNNISFDKGSAGICHPKCIFDKQKTVLKITLAALAVLLVFSLAAAPASAGVPVPWINNNDTGWYGDGSATSFEISTEAQLAGLAYLVNGGNNFTGKTIKLVADLDLSGSDHQWTPIGWVNYSNPESLTYYPFNGTFDGNGKTISNLYINGDENFQGLFGYTDGTTINNLGLINVNITGGNNVGGLVGWSSGAGTIENCYATGTVTSIRSGIGGLVGNNAGTIENCYATVAVTCDGDNVGGLVGWNTGGNITNCYATGAVKGTSGVGGFGGLAGQNNKGTITNSTALNPFVNATGYNVGRVGYNGGGTIQYNYALKDMLVNGETVSQNDYNGENKSSADLMTESTYTGLGWDFTNTWIMGGIVDNSSTKYPILKWQTKTVTFESNGGSDIDYKIVMSGTTVAEPADPTRDGYNFGGWYTESDTVYDFAALVRTDITLYAKWTEKSYNVTFVANNGTAAEWNRSVNHGALVSQPETPEYEGHNFHGWNNSTGQFDFNTPIIEDTKLTANWTANVTTLNFTTFGETAQDDVTATYNETLSTLTVPTKAGYTFGGYFIDNNITGLQLYNETCAVNKSLDDYTDADGKWINSTLGNGETVKLYAKWTAITYNVTFVANNGTAAEWNRSVNHGALVSQPATPEYEGHNFHGWNNSTGQFDFNTPIIEDTRLTANWTANVTTLNFTTYCGTAQDDVTATYNETLSTLTVPTKTGYTFGGYFIDNNVTGLQLYNETCAVNKSTGYTDSDGKWINSTLSDGSILILHAKWTAITYNVTFVANNGTAAEWNRSVNHGALVSQPETPEYEGHNFHGWNNTTGQFDFSTPILEDTKLTANWTANVTTLNFTTFGETAQDDVTATYNDTLTDLSAPTKDGYTFGGYFIDNNVTGLRLYKETGAVNKSLSGYTDENGKWINSTIANGETVKLYANWTAITYTVDVKFDELKGKVTCDKPMVKSDDKYVISNIPYNSELTFTFAPSTGNTVKNVTVNGTANGPITTLKLENIQSAHTIKVEFWAQPTEKPTETKTVTVEVPPETKNAGVEEASVILSENDPKDQAVNISAQIIEPEKDYGEIPSNQDVIIIIKIDAKYQPENGIATVNFTIDKDKISSPDRINVLHNVFDAASGTWIQKPVDNLKITLSGNFYVIEFTTATFSYFSVTETVSSSPYPQSGGSSTDTGSGNYKEYDRSVTDGGAVSFGTSPIVTEVDLPKGTTGQVALIAESDTPAPEGKQTVKVFEINIPNYPSGKESVVKFKLTLTEIEKAGYTPSDICLYHCDKKGVWTKLPTTYTIKDGVVYYEAVTTAFSPFAIVFEEDGAADVSQPVVTPVKTQTAEPVSTYVEPTKTAVPTTEQTKSPVGFVGLGLGLLGAAVVLRRK